MEWRCCYLPDAFGSCIRILFWCQSVSVLSWIKGWKQLCVSTCDVIIYHVVNVVVLKWCVNCTFVSVGGRVSRLSESYNSLLAWKRTVWTEDIWFSGFAFLSIYWTPLSSMCHQLTLISQIAIVIGSLCYYCLCVMQSSVMQSVYVYELDLMQCVWLRCSKTWKCYRFMNSFFCFCFLCCIDLIFKLIFACHS